MDFWQDIRHGARLLKRSPGFFTVATLSLALGIGANTAIFQLLDAVRLRLLPVPHPEQLAELQIAENEHCCSGNFSDRYPNLTYPQWEQIREHQQAFSGIFAWADQRFNLASGGEARYAEGLWVSGDYFKTLGVQPLIGRMLAAEDDRPGCGSPGGGGSWKEDFSGWASRGRGGSGARQFLWDGGGAQFRCDSADLRGTVDQRRRQPSGKAASLVAGSDRTPETGLDCCEGNVASQRYVARRVREYCPTELPS